MSPQAGELLLNEVAPRIRSSIRSFNTVGSEDREELCQDAIVIAAVLLLSTEARGKKVTPGNIAYYAVGLVRQGRRSSGQSTTDVLSPRTQINGRSSMVSLDAPLTGEPDGEEIMCLHETLACRAEDPAIAASRHLDWEPLVASLDPNTRKVLGCLAIGEDLTTLVPKMHRSRSALQTDKERLARLVTEHFGPNILVLAQERPRWRDNVEANREKLACRYER